MGRPFDRLTSLIPPSISMSSPLRRSPTPSSTSTSIPTSTSNPPITTTTSTTTTAAPTIPKTALFTFRPAPSSPPLTFPFRPSSSSSSTATHDPITPLKRPRPLTDIDGELSTLGKKKRRLRLFLITSRLSRPFSLPASNIVDRGSSKIAVWAKQKSSLGRHLLRKAAILNRIRRRAAAAAAAGGGVAPQGENERRQLEIARAAFADAAHEMHTRPVLQRPPPFPPTAAVREGRYFALSGCVGASAGASAYPASRYPGISGNPGSGANATANATATGGSRPWSGPPSSPYSYPCPPPPPAPPSAAPPVCLPRRNYLPLPPSPLGISNYDALDLEDEVRSPYDDDDDDLSSSDAEMLGSPCSTSASYSSTVETSSDAARTPPFPVQYYSDFSVLDPEEAVVGDYDGVDGPEGVEPIWPGDRLGGEVRKFGGVGTDEEEEVVVFKFY